MKNIMPGVVVKNIKTGGIGVLCTSYLKNYDKSKEAPIVYKGDDIKLLKGPEVSLTSLNILERHILEQEEMLTGDHLELVCRLGAHETCKYLVDKSKNGRIVDYACARVMGDQTMADFIEQQAAAGRMRGIAHCGGKFPETENAMHEEDF
jgi:hypothetical protein